MRWCADRKVGCGALSLLKACHSRARVLEIPIKMNRVENIDSVTLTSLPLYFLFREMNQNILKIYVHGNFSSLYHTAMHL